MEKLVPLWAPGSLEQYREQLDSKSIDEDTGGGLAEGHPADEWVQHWPIWIDRKATSSRFDRQTYPRPGREVGPTDMGQCWRPG
jgi:hypothetical protein